MSLATWKRLTLAAAALALATAGASAAHAADAPEVLRVGLFAVTLPEKAALERGFFKEEHLDVKFLQVTGSVQQFQYLRDGQYDLVQTGPDNVVNYKVNPKNPLGTLIDAQVVDSMDLSMGMRLVAQPEFKTVESLRGKKLCVDAPKSGYAYVVYEIYKRHGLGAADYVLDPIGGVFIRYQAMLKGACDATLLNYGFEVQAAAAGRQPLDTVLTVSNPYIGTATAGKRDWMMAHRSQVVRFERGLYRGLRWVLDPANREAAVAMLTGPNTPRAVAEQLYAASLDPELGLSRDMKVNRKGLYNIVAMRAEYGGFDTPQDLARLAGPAGGLYDLSYWAEATGLSPSE